MKLPVYLSLCLSLALVSCNQGEDHRTKELQSEVDALQQKQFEAQQAAKRLQGQIEASRAERTKLEEERGRISAERDAARKEAEDLKKEFENYKSRYKVSMRKRAPGMKLEDFAIDGTEFRNVSMKELTETMVSFTHESGFKKVELGQLPQHLQALLGFGIEETSRDVTAGKPLSKKDVKAQKYLREGAARDAVEQVKKKITEANGFLLKAKQQRTQAAGRHQPVRALDDYISHMELTLERLKVQATEAELYVREVDLQFRNVQ